LKFCVSASTEKQTTLSGFCEKAGFVTHGFGQFRDNSRMNRFVFVTNQFRDNFATICDIRDSFATIRDIRDNFATLSRHSRQFRDNFATFATLSRQNVTKILRHLSRQGSATHLATSHAQRQSTDSTGSEIQVLDG